MAMPRQKSLLREDGLSETTDSPSLDTPRRERPQNVRFRSRDEVHVVDRPEEEEENASGDRTARRRASPAQPPSQSPLPPGTHTTIYRLGAAVLLLGTLFSLLQSFGFIRHDAAIPIQGVNGGPVPNTAQQEEQAMVERRDISATSWCFRWAMQSAIVNGTLYMYGGELTSVQGQTQNNWTNNFISLDLSKSWGVASPALTGLQAPTGPPEVALGYLWNSADALYLYGGEVSWQPAVLPVAFATWEYDIAGAQWTEYSNPVTSAGLNAPDDDVAVQRAAEGAGVMVPSLGRGFYFGGHEDAYTTPGWSVVVPRLYLQSLLEFTLPGYTNPDVDSLKGGSTAPAGGVYRNITEGGVQNQGGFTTRADGVLVYVPGFGAEGILVALAGGTNETFTQMNVINIYDIATSSWYDQYTSGAYPDVRVNPCAVVAAAPDGSSYNIYMFGGQNLVPYDQQIQYQDMWILSIPSFIWIKVDQSTQSVPYGRSGATCEIWNAQMVVVGGYVGPGLSCETGTYVFDLSTLQWAADYTIPVKAASASNFLNQQPEQLYKDVASPGGLAGSYGYTVPDVVVDKIGGNKYGGATITKPVTAAPGGPLKTGSPIIYTTTSKYTTTLPNGHKATETSTTTGYGPSGSSSSNSGKEKTTEIAAIVVGVVCGLALIVIAYLVFCLFLYRKQLALYKRHVSMSQAAARGGGHGHGHGNEKLSPGGGLFSSSPGDTSDRSKFLTPAESASQAGSSSQDPFARSQGNSGSGSARRSSEVSSTDDLLNRNSPTFVGVMLHPRRSLRVVNRD